MWAHALKNIYTHQCKCTRERVWVLKTSKSKHIYHHKAKPLAMPTYPHAAIYLLTRKQLWMHLSKQQRTALATCSNPRRTHVPILLRGTNNQPCELKCDLLIEVVLLRHNPILWCDCVIFKWNKTINQSATPRHVSKWNINLSIMRHLCGIKAYVQLKHQFINLRNQEACQLKH